MLAALAVRRPTWRRVMVKALDPAREQALLAAIVRDGPAVDGVSLRREATIDGLAIEAHHEILRAILTITRNMWNQP